MNEFDRVSLSGMGDLDGFLKKAVKKVKKVVSKANTVRKKIAKKTNPKLYKASTKVGRKVMSSKLGQVAVLAAGSVLLGPAVVALAGAIGAPAAGVLTKAATALSKKALSDGVKKAAGANVKREANKQVKTLQAQMTAIDQINAQVKADPEFARVISNLKKAGKTDAQIIKEWSSSKLSTQLAAISAKNAVAPAITADLIKQGLKPDVAAQQAEVIAQGVANDAVKQARIDYVAPTVTAVATAEASAKAGSSPLIPILLLTTLL